MLSIGLSNKTQIGALVLSPKFSGILFWNFRVSMQGYWYQGVVPFLIVGC